MGGSSLILSLGQKGTPPRELTLVTHRGRRIPNYVALPPSARTAALRAKTAQKHGPRWRLRVEPGGVYNCAGHALASRRTAIDFDQADPEIGTFEKVLDRILQDDGWVKLTVDPMPGDLVLYWDGPKKDHCLHVGVVSWVEEGGLRSIWVLSKWDDSSGEYLHTSGDIGHVRELSKDVVLEYWRNVLRNAE